jgi:hypothetical protein
MEVPDCWRDYPCQDYFSSPLAVDGLWDESSQLWLIESAEGVKEEAASKFLQVGRPGVDSIGLGYRKGHPGFWALHRIVEQEFQYLASTIQEFLEGWFAGSVVV